MKSGFSLLYSQLWLVDKIKLGQINPDALNLKSREYKSGEYKPDHALVRHTITNVNQAKVKADDSKADASPLLIADKGLSISAHTSGATSNAGFESADGLILDWNALVNQASSCVSCKLCKGRTNVVIERGSRSAPFMFVGEGPGEDEDIQGVPFVGKSGQLLDKMIAAMGLDKNNDVYICNVVKCRPPYNRNPEADEIAACNYYLRSQIEMVKPKIIIALGRFASQTLLDSNLATGKLRGRIHKYKNIPLVVTYHPAYLLRNPNAKKDAWADLKLAMSSV